MVVSVGSLPVSDFDREIRRFVSAWANVVAIPFIEQLERIFKTDDTVWYLKEKQDD